MKHVELSTQGEAVQQFFLSLSLDPDGSIVELDGQAVARVTRVKGQGNGAIEVDGPWTDEKNQRRCTLSDREFDHTLTAQEAEELAALQRQMLRERQRLAPVPLDDLRRLHQELLSKARKKSRKQEAN